MGYAEDAKDRLYKRLAKEFLKVCAPFDVVDRKQIEQVTHKRIKESTLSVWDSQGKGIQGPVMYHNGRRVYDIIFATLFIVDKLTTPAKDR